MIPVSRLQSIRGSDLARSTEATRHTGPCGGFSTQYACMCDLHAVPYREEVAWVSSTFIEATNLFEIQVHKNKFHVLCITRMLTQYTYRTIQGS